MPANSSWRATESPIAPFRAEATVIGPVGLAETISTWIVCGCSAEPPPYACPAARISPSASPNQAGVSQRLTKPGPATSVRSTSSSPAAAAASSSPSSRGERRWTGASCIATLVA